MEASDEVATAKARRLGCRVLAVSRRGRTARVLVDVPDWNAIHAVTRAAIYDGMWFESQTNHGDIRRIQKTR